MQAAGWYLVNKMKIHNALLKPMHFKWLIQNSAQICLRCISTSNQKLLANHYDIIISGGGMVGFAAASALGQSSRLKDKKILILEKQQKRSWNMPEEYSNRVSALNTQTKDFLSKIGAWSLIQSMRAQPIKKMQVWEANSEAMISFDEKEGCSIAHIVENDVVINALQKTVPDNVHVLFSSNIINIKLPMHDSDERPEITLDCNKKLTTDLLIGADGHFSSVRKAMNSRYVSWNYDQSAIVATLILTEEQDNNVAWQKFLPTGPIAILPLSSTRSSLVWSTTKSECSNLMSLSEEQFTDALNNSLWQESVDSRVKAIHSQWQNFLSTFSSSSKGILSGQQLPPSISLLVLKSRASFPLGLGHSANYVGPKVALIGDAAHRVHPLAGQGVNLGFGDVDCLLKCLESSVINGLSYTDDTYLKKYEMERQRHNVPFMASIDLLYRLYSTDFMPIVLLRSLGLSAVHCCMPLKEKIRSFAAS